MKTIWAPVVFLTGLAAGVLLDRGFTRDTPASLNGRTLTSAPPPASSMPPEAPTADVMSPSTAVRSPAATVSSAPAAVGMPAELRAESPAAVDESAPVQPIDVGPAFRTQFAATKKQGFHDQTAELHAALERETRDDSWSYPLEADIQNSLVSDTSAGNFKAEHVECRSSICEIRLSATDPQQAKALQKWTEAIHTLTWSSQVNMTSMLTISDAGRSDTLVLLTRPQNPAQPR